MRSNTGLLRLALAYASLLGSMSLVVWRTSHALDLARDLENTRTELAIAEAARSELIRRIEFLESRARVVQEAEARLGLHVPSGEELVILPLGERVPPASRQLAATRVGTGVALR
jgi:hypothetical protein